MSGAILSIFDQIIEFLNGESLQNILSMGLDTYLHDAYNLVLYLQRYVVGPLALAILSIFVLLEFQKISLKVEGAGGAPMLGFEMIIKALIKFVICYIIVVRVQFLLDGILVITANLTSRIVEAGNNHLVQNLTEQVRRAVEALSWWEQLVALLVMCVQFLVALVVRVLIQVTIYLRFLELYIYCAMAPIPMSALPSQEFSTLTKGFFKNFAASGLHASFIALMLVIYPALFLQVMNELGGGLWGIVLGMTVYMIAMLFSINKTKMWAKTLLAA